MKHLRDHFKFNFPHYPKDSIVGFMHMKKILTLVSLSILLSACGKSGGSNSGTNPEQSHGDITYAFADRPFPDDNVWNQDISKQPVDPNSDAYITSIGKNSPVIPDFGTVWDGAPLGMPYVVVSGNQKKVPVSFEYPASSDKGPYPIPADAPIQGGPNGTGDRHVLVVDKDNGLLYELFNAFKNNDGSWRATSGAIFDLKSNKTRPDNWTSADAAGLPIFPGLVRYEEVVEEGEIRHALRVTVNATRRAYVFPATHQAGSSQAANLPPMGLRLRLKANFDITPFPKNVQVILKALKKYGMIIADNGASWLLCGAPDPRWDDAELHKIRQVPGSAFEAVKHGELKYTPWP